MCPDIVSWHESTLVTGVPFGAGLHEFELAQTGCGVAKVFIMRQFFIPMRSTTLGVASWALAMFLLPAAASAVTLDQVVALSKAGVSESVIVALVQRDGTVFTIEPEQVVTLQKDGLSDSLIMTLLKSGRAEGEEAARADAASKANSIAATLSPAPDVVIVGHGPDVPNTFHYNGFYSGPPLPLIDPLAYGFPGAYGFVGTYGIPVTRARVARAPRLHDDAPAPRAMCLAQVSAGPSAANVSRPFVTECPAAMQTGKR
jgi:hypothetical protein